VYSGKPILAQLRAMFCYILVPMHLLGILNALDTAEKETVSQGSGTTRQLVGRLLYVFRKSSINEQKIKTVFNN
jgi:hypothetical protein